MAKAKRKPDFSKPKPQKKSENLEQELDSQNIDTENQTDSDDWDLDDTSNNIEDSDYAEYKAQAEKEGYDTSKYYVNLPLVVIAGRPNVGKSTLFNRFMHRRLAIVDPTPGVTRDPVEATAFIMGKPVRLVDTGGYKLDRDPTSRESE
ncbi:MAG: 50S ribosome-binding GTPase, partial [Treponema sp.]|nr:50S ribosome-binding GTPase [Treponema sp.]